MLQKGSSFLNFTEFLRVEAVPMSLIWEALLIMTNLQIIVIRMTLQFPAAIVLFLQPTAALGPSLASFPGRRL